MQWEAWGRSSMPNPAGPNDDITTDPGYSDGQEPVVDSTFDTSNDLTTLEDYSVDPTLDGGTAIPKPGHQFLDLLMPVVGEEDWHGAMQVLPAAYRVAQDRQERPSSTEGLSEPAGVRTKVLKFAESFLGTPYKWGGTTPAGFDCSGLIWYATRSFGLNLPRGSWDQATAGKIAPLNELKPGDLVAFNTQEGGGADHIAFYLGNGKILESPHTGATVRIRSLGHSDRFWGVHLTYPGER